MRSTTAVPAETAAEGYVEISVVNPTPEIETRTAQHAVTSTTEHGAEDEARQAAEHGVVPAGGCGRSRLWILRGGLCRLLFR
jgi:hypothetical protein